MDIKIIDNDFMRNPRKNDRNKEMIADYSADVPIPEISGKYGISSSRIYEILDDYGVPRRGIENKKERNKKLASDARRKVPVSKMATRYGISQSRVYEILSRMGLSRRQK